MTQQQSTTRPPRILPDDQPFRTPRPVVGRFEESRRETIVCWLCKGTGVYPHRSSYGTTCWTCSGRGEIVVIRRERKTEGRCQAWGCKRPVEAGEHSCPQHQLVDAF